ncbi:hypothetical protein D1007_00234 [Hordeum vulgare]|nr:hypothetical protein D1007_00234 [Hordeum vulgare]
MAAHNKTAISRCPSRRGTVVPPVPLDAEHTAVTESVLQRNEQARRAAPVGAAAPRVVTVEGAAEVRAVHDVVVPEGEGAGAVEARAQQGGAGGEPVARVLYCEKSTYLDENKQLILAILDNQNNGKVEECARFLSVELSQCGDSEIIIPFLVDQRKQSNSLLS